MMINDEFFCTADCADEKCSNCVSRRGWLACRDELEARRKEAVTHPLHYGGDTVYETIKVIEAWDLGFCLGNAVKYISRAGHKGDALEDLKKARWYLDRRIQQLEGGR